MNWSKDKSINLSLIFLLVFKILLALSDAFLIFVLPKLFEKAEFPIKDRWGIIIGLLIGSVFAWILLFKLTKLLKNIKFELVFTRENVNLLRIVSWCCTGGAVASLLASFFYLPFIFIAVGAAFMMLICRIIKNAFQQAVDMKEELDLTI